MYIDRIISIAILAIWFKCTYARSVHCIEDNDGSKFPSADNSTWYYDCRNGSLLLKMCPYLHVYQDNLKQCILPDSMTGSVTTTSSNSEIIFPDELSGTEEPTTYYSLDIFEIESTTNFTVPVFTNSDPIDDPSLDLLEKANPCPCQDTMLPTYIANRFNCQIYYMCYRSRPLELSCCQGQHWSQQHKKCIHQHESSCGIRPESATIKLPSCPERGCAVFPHLTVCEYFYYCEDGVRSIQQCDAFNQWDFYSQRCVIRSEAKCITSVPIHLRAQLYLR